MKSWRVAIATWPMQTVFFWCPLSFVPPSRKNMGWLSRLFQWEMMWSWEIPLCNPIMGSMVWFLNLEGNPMVKSHRVEQYILPDHGLKCISHYVMYDLTRDLIIKLNIIVTAVWWCVYTEYTQYRKSFDLWVNCSCLHFVSTVTCVHVVTD